MDARVLESHKENIQPRALGRPALKLGAALTTTRPSLDTDRARLERALTADDLDDPLQAYLDYIEWTHCHFPQGNNADSGLLALLERCTLCFRDTPYYKDDPRYLKVWLEYAGYLDLPRDIFVYLAKKEIGRALALYYEEFARYLEAHGAAADARQVYEVGLERGARPAPRLRRSFAHFCARAPDSDFAASCGAASTGAAPTVSAAAVAHAPGSFSRSPPTKRARLHIFADAGRPSLRDTVFATDPDPQLHPVALRTKENTIAPQPWAGQVLEQKTDRTQAPPHFEVFRDPHESSVRPSAHPSAAPQIPPPAPGTDFDVVPQNGLHYTLVRHPGKPTEKLSINLALVYPSPDEEYSFAEILALARKFASPSNHSPSLPPSPSPANATFTIPLRDDTTTNHPPSPTITMVSRATTNEVFSMFNSAAQNIHLDNDLDDGLAVNTEDSTNFDGFVTETLVQPAREPETPPTDHYDSEPHVPDHSSPFLDRPPSRVVDPTSTSLRRNLLQQARVESIAGFHKYPRATAKFPALLNLAPHTSKAVSKGNPHSLITFCGREIFSLRYELGRGGYGVVFLAENETGSWKAVKAESPASSWEFYILTALHARIPEHVRHQIVQPEALYLFDDESYLIINYVSQGTILNVVNMYADQNRVVDEMVTIYLTTVLLRLIENLHNAGIIHGDLKADNCMINFEDPGILSEQFTPHDPTWNKKSLVLIDFGRAIDLNLFEFPNRIQFVSNWETDEQDCPQMAKNEPWRFEADYFGIAAIVHTMLFGRYIETRMENGRYVLRALMKRYWQCELWAPFFDLLLNPYYGESSNMMPITEKLRSVRHGFEQWLSSPTQSRKLRAEIIKIERELDDKHHKIMKQIK